MYSEEAVEVFSKIRADFMMNRSQRHRRKLWNFWKTVWR